MFPAYLDISIHTSAREVTAGQEVSHKALGISIHTSAREVTTHPVCWMWTGLDFNPHFRKGSDLPVYFIQTGIWDFNPHFRKGSDANRAIWQQEIPISIHTSAREVTVRWMQYSDKTGFQSTLPQGKWRYNREIRENTEIFQSTLPQGKWRETWGYADQCCNISIHTSAREVTALMLTLPDSVAISIHTSAREVTVCSSPVYGSIHISIHTSAREVTRSGCHRWINSENFNPHFRKGSDPCYR